MNAERATIIRAQKHGWIVATVTEACVMMRRAWIVAGRDYQLFIFPGGNVTARVETRV